jgi:hypothetical protein
MDHYFPDVPGLGNVAVSSHAQARMVEDGISDHDFKEALLNGSTTPDGARRSLARKGWRQGGHSSTTDAIQGSDAGKDRVYRVRPIARAAK